MEYIVDNSGSYAESGSWGWSTWGGYGAHSRYHTPGLGSFASWLMIVPPDSWNMQAAWASHANRSSAVTYQLLDESKAILREVTVNQKLPPVGPTVGHRTFQFLFNYPTSFNVTVRILSAEDGYVDADAIRFVNFPDE